MNVEDIAANVEALLNTIESRLETAGKHCLGLRQDYDGARSEVDVKWRDSKRSSTGLERRRSHSIKAEAETHKVIAVVSIHGILPVNFRTLG